MTLATEVLCAGIVVADHINSPIPHLPSPGELVLAERLLLTIGGCAANVAVDLAKLGVSAAVVGRVGNDVFGRIVADMLRERQVDVSALQISPNMETSQTLIINVAGQDRRFIHTFGANAAFHAADIPLERVAQCRVLYLGGYLLMNSLQADELVPVFAAARHAGAKTVLDVATPGPADYLPQVEKILPYVDVFLPNDLEAEVILGEKDVLRQAERFQQMGAQTVIITRGDRGAVLVSPRVRLRAESYRVPFVDGTGGGDAFAAGLLAGLLEGFPLERAARLAALCGALACTVLGDWEGAPERADVQRYLPEAAEWWP